METSNLIQEIESTMLDMKDQKRSIASQGVAADFLENVKQSLKKVKDVLEQDGAAKNLVEEIETMIKQMEENNNGAKFESLTQMFEKWDKTLQNVVNGVKNLDK